MATVLKGRETRQFSVYLPGAAYERFRAWFPTSGYKSESEALLRCPRRLLWPEEYADDSEVALKDAIAQQVQEQVTAHLSELSAMASPGAAQQRRWLSTREAFEELKQDLDDIGVEWDRFRRLPDDQLTQRYNLVGDRSRRRHGSTTAKWLYFAD